MENIFIRKLMSEVKYAMPCLSLKGHTHTMTLPLHQQILREITFIDKMVIGAYYS